MTQSAYSSSVLAILSALLGAACVLVAYYLAASRRLSIPSLPRIS